MVLKFFRKLARAASIVDKLMSDYHSLLSVKFFNFKKNTACQTTWDQWNMSEAEILVGMYCFCLITV